MLRFRFDVALAVVVIAGAVVPAALASERGRASFTAISHGGGQYCAVTRAGGVVCWGENRFGQVGDGTHGNRDRPVEVVGLAHGIKAVAAGGSHTCALTTAGGVKCWGRNVAGQLGNGTTVSSSTPVDVVGLQSGAKAIAAGTFHTCALLTGGGVKCWGANNNRELGDGTNENRSRPVDVVGLGIGITALSLTDIGDPIAGTIENDSSCAITTAGGVKCWGGGRTPLDYPGLTSDVAAIDISTPCALTTAGAAKCAYSGHALAIVPGLESGIQAINQFCAVTNAGGVKCWADQTTGIIRTPAVDVVGLTSGVRAIAFHCAVMSSGWIKCWGCGFHGHGGFGHGICLKTPVDVLAPIPANASPAAAKPSGSAKPAGSASGSVSGGCSRATAVALANRLRLGNAGYTPNPVAQVLCGAFAGPGSKAMVFSLTIPSCGRTGGWVVFRSTAGSWRLVQQVYEGGDLVIIGSGIRETQFVLRSGDAHCFPTGGTRSRVWHWNGSRLSTGAWGYSKTQGQGQAPAPASTALSVSVSDVSPQRLLVQRSVIVNAHCSQACTLSATGKVSILGGTYQTSLLDAKGSLASAGTQALTLRLRPFDIGFLPRAMKGQNGQAVVQVVAVDRAGHKVSRQTVIVVLPARPATGTSPGLRDFMVGVESRLADLAAGRQRLKDALSGALNCSLSYASAGLALQGVVDNRARIWNQLNAMRPPTAQTVALLAQLKTAVDHAISADRKYWNWLTGLQRTGAGCPPSPGGAFTSAGRDDTLATQAKQRFAAGFNPLARQLGLRTWAATEF